MNVPVTSHLNTTKRLFPYENVPKERNEVNMLPHVTENGPGL